MDLNVVCSVALGFSLFLIVLAVVAGVAMHRAELKNTGIEGRRRVLTPFQVFLVCFFFAAVTIFFPIYYIDYFAAETGFLKGVKSFLLAVQNVLRLVTLNGEFNNIRDFLGDPSRVNAVLAQCYSIYASVIFVSAPLLTAGFVLSFFRNASAMFRYCLRPCRELYVMSELNECSLALAKNILGQKRRGQLVIFADVFEEGGEQNFELLFTARRLGAICVKKDVAELGLKYARKCKRKIYLIGRDEDENIGQALKLIRRHRGTRFDNEDLEFYIFSRTAESETLFDSVDHGNMRLRRINEGRSLALKVIKTYPIFPCAEGNEKRIRIALVGFGGYGKQFLKLVCCFGQMPGWAVELHVFDGGSAQAQLKAMAPELLAYNGKKIEGEAEYSIVFHDNVNVKSVEFIEEFSSINDYTGVYVALGEDELNIETAMRLRTAIRRNSSAAATPIYAVVYDPAKAEIVANGGLKNMEGEDYGITFIGSLQESYSIENIEQREMEESAAALHMRWAKTDAEKEEARKKFEQYEYYRKSSIMQAVYRSLRMELGFERQSDDTPEGRANNDLLRRYEHRRWNTYMRGEGYICGEKKDHIAKTHPLLIPFDDLPEEEKKKDDF